MKNSLQQLYEKAKANLIDEQINGKDNSRKLKQIHIELEKKKRLDIFDEAINDAAMESVNLRNVMSGMKIDFMIKPKEFSRHDLTGFLAKAGNINSFETEAQLIDKNLEETLGIAESTIICSVTGDSMNGVSIYEGDTLICESKKVPNDGDIVVVEINGKKFVKRYVVKDGIIWFNSENKNYLPVEVTSDMKIKYLAVVRSVLHKL